MLKKYLHRAGDRRECSCRKQTNKIELKSNIKIEGCNRDHEFKVTAEVLVVREGSRNRVLQPKGTVTANKWKQNSQSLCVGTRQQEAGVAEVEEGMGASGVCDSKTGSGVENSGSSWLCWQSVWWVDTEGTGCQE